MKKLIEKYKDVIAYIILGILTTLVNIVVYWLIAHPLGWGVMLSTVIAWIASVLFAYWTNRKWVFHSTTSTNREILKEISSFFTCRLITGIIDWMCMFVFVDVLKINDLIIKIAANIVVIILNYIASKLIIFKKK